MQITMEEILGCEAKWQSSTIYRDLIEDVETWI